MPTICNPMNLPYHFRPKGTVRREAADPSVVKFNDKFWLFPSKSDGYWWSVDLNTWHFIETDVLPTEDYAPDVRVMNDWLYFTASRGGGSNCPIFRTQDPMANNWELVSEPFTFWDPNMFQDDDGRVYLYWGCSDKKPICGIEMNPDTMQPIGDKVELITQNHDKYGWERKSENSRESNPPYIEGAWMTKHDGKYYLQYAGPGTEFNTYADGVYEGDSPLGPFTYAANNPMSFQPGGYITGAGHGSTFQDDSGNWWHISTMRISVKHCFERRLGLWPAGFDQDGVMFCNNRFGDYPMRLPDGKWNDPWTEPSTDWMLLNYKKPVECSSSDGECPAEQAVNENVRNYWAAAEGDEQPWISVDLGNPYTVNALQINFAEHECTRPPIELRHQYEVLGSPNGKDWEMLVDKTENMEDVPHDYIELGTPVECQHIKVLIHHMPSEGRAALSGLRVFGHGAGDKPAPTTITKAKLLDDDPLTAEIKWAEVPGAIGYNVRWGMSPDKLYHDWLVYEATNLDLTAINKGQDTWVAVEAFNENGVADLSPVVKIAGD